MLKKTSLSLLVNNLAHLSFLNDKPDTRLEAKIKKLVKQASKAFWFGLISLVAIQCPPRIEHLAESAKLGLY